jgi:hypothetical protein
VQKHRINLLKVDGAIRGVDHGLEHRLEWNGCATQGQVEIGVSVMPETAISVRRPVYSPSDDVPPIPLMVSRLASLNV